MAISSIGSNSRHYVDIDSWLADLPATLTEPEIAELYNDSEFITTSGINIQGITTTETNNLIIRAAAGQSYRDNYIKSTYDPLQGVAIAKNSNYGRTITSSVNHLTLSGLQIKGQSVSSLFSAGTDLSVKECILQTNSTSFVDCIIVSGASRLSLFENSVVMLSSSAGDGIEYDSLNSSIINNLFISGSSSGNGIKGKYGTPLTGTVKNNIIFGFSTPISSGSWDLADNNYNATDAPLINSGGDSIVNIDTSVFVDFLAEDYKTSIGSSLAASGEGGGFIGYALESGGGGTTATITEIGPSFTESINVNYSANISGTVTESGPSFTESISTTLTKLSISASITESGPSFTEAISATITPSLSIVASITEPGPSFTESISVTQASNILAGITETGPSFVESINLTLNTTVEAAITESGPSFTEMITAEIPIKIAFNPKNVITVKRSGNTVKIKRKTNIKRVN